MYGDNTDRLLRRYLSVPIPKDRSTAEEASLRVQLISWLGAVNGQDEQDAQILADELRRYNAADTTILYRALLVIQAEAAPVST